MAWTAPLTATLNMTLTAAQWNTHVRDNLLVTEAAKATTRGRYFTSYAANSIRERSWFMNADTTTKSTTSTSYGDLSGGSSGPQLSSTVGTIAIVFWSVAMGNTTAGAETWCSVEAGGDVSVAASDDWAIMTDGISAATSTDNLIRMSGAHRFTGLGFANPSTFALKYRVSSGTGWFSHRAISVLAL